MIDTQIFENEKNVFLNENSTEQTIEKLKKTTGYLSYEIEMKIKTILDEDQDLLNLVKSGQCSLEDILSDDELNQIKFDPLKPVYDQIKRNVNEKGGGYAQTLDFKLKEELIQRSKQEKWLSSRSKISAFNQKFSVTRPLDYSEQNTIVHPVSLNIIQQPQSRLKTAYISRKGQMTNICSKYGPLNNNDLQVYLQPESIKTNEIISMDRINIEVIQFCSSLFLSWVEDYQLEAQIQKTRNKTEHLFAMNEAVDANVELNCIPIDYFLQRMLQIGLCTSLNTIKQLIETMLLLCNAGKAPNYQIFTSQNQLSNLSLNNQETRSHVNFGSFSSSKMVINEEDLFSNKQTCQQTQNELSPEVTSKNSE